MSLRTLVKTLVALLAVHSSAAFAAAAPQAEVGRHLNRPASSSPPASTVANPSEPPLPPLPQGVTELNFSGFFKSPVGPRGLEISEALLALNGRRVRILGYMVREQTADHDELPAAQDASSPPAGGAVPDRFLLTALPQTTNFAHYGLCEDLPPQVVYVTVARTVGALVAHTEKRLLLTGVLSIGAQPEPDGRVSVVRLKLDPTYPDAR